MLVVFPLGLLSTAVIFDILYVVTGNDQLAVFALWAIAAGVVGGLLAAVFGVWDWLAIPDDTRAKRVGRLHGGGNAVLIALFAISWVLRLDHVAYLPETPLPLVLGLLGAGLALVTAWLGGELVYRLRVGVDDRARLNASSSLSESVVADVERPA